MLIKKKKSRSKSTIRKTDDIKRKRFNNRIFPKTGVSKEFVFSAFKFKHIISSDRVCRCGLIFEVRLN